MGLRKFSSRRIGETIKRIRLGLGLSQEQFGIKVGNYSQDTVAKWEAGQIPHALVLQRISEMSHPHRSVQWILNTDKLQGDESSEFTSAGSNRALKNAPTGGQALQHDPETTRNTRANNLYYIDGSHDEGQGSTSHFTPKSIPAPRPNPFDILIDQIRIVMREEIREALQNGQAEPSATSKEWFRAEELAQQYDLPKTWFEDRGREGTLRRIKPGRHMLFLRSDVKKYFDSHNTGRGNNN